MQKINDSGATVSEQSVQVKASDDYQLSAKLYASNKETREYIIIGSAFAVPKQYYRHIAQFFAENGINVLTFDYRGISDSFSNDIDMSTLHLKDWAEQDLDALIGLAKNNYQAEKVYYLGHSCGGQIIGLAKNSVMLDKIILAATGVASWDKWPGLSKYGMWLVWKLLFPISMFARRKSMYRSTLLGPVPVPRTLVEQWLAWARSDDYLFSMEHGLDISRYQQLDIPLHKFSVTDDLYAPKAAMDSLAERYSNTEQSETYLHPKKIGLKKIGHFGIFRKKVEISQGIWQPMLSFLRQ